jgi:hypothetical protein
MVYQVEMVDREDLVEMEAMGLVNHTCVSDDFHVSDSNLILSILSGQWWQCYYTFERYLYPCFS